jgi:hypothetical protein
MRINGRVGGPGRRSLTAVLAGGLALTSLGLTSCSAISAIKKVVHNVENNKHTMDAFTNKIKAGENVAFEATYVTTGSAPATIVYATEPPKGLLFTDTQTATKGGNDNGNNNNVYFIVNPQGEYACSRPDTGSKQWQCDKLPKASASTYKAILDFYTPSHWVTFLDDFALAAGFAGDKVSDSTFSINGFNMSCVDFVAPGVKGTSKICTTSANILGYVKVAGDSTSFEIKSYSSSPSSSLIALPAGAKITTVTVPPSSTSTTS